MAFAAALRTVFVDADLQARRCPPKPIRRAASIASSASPSLRSSGEVGSAASQTASRRARVSSLNRSEETGQRLKVDLTHWLRPRVITWFTVMAAMLTTSSTVAPSASAFTGWGSPTKMGPTAVAPPSSRSSL